MENISTQQLAADTILDIGVKLKVKAPMFLRLLFIKTLTLTIKQPYLGTCIRATRYYLKAQKIGIEAENFTDALIARDKTARLIAKAVAVYILRGRLASWLFAPLLAKILINGVSSKTLLNVMNIAVTSGVEDFMTTIRLTAHLNPMMPNLSPMEQRS